MKNSIAIILVLVLTSIGLFASVAIPVNNDKESASIHITSYIKDFSTFGVSLNKIESDSFTSIAKFQDSVSSSVDTKVDMLMLNSMVDVGFLSGINNTRSDVYLSITVDKLVSGKDSVDLVVSPKEATLSPAKNSRFGTLQNALIQVQEKEAGSAALAPAGTYTTTVTIALVTVA